MTFFMILFGLLVGSFLNVVIYRTPLKQSIIAPPSHCPACNHRLTWLDLFPIVSFLWLKGRCRYCHVKVSWRYPLVELVTGFLSWAAWMRFGFTVETAVYLLFTFALVVIAFIDYDHQIIPNFLTYPGLIIGLLFQLWRGALVEALVGGLIGGGVLLLIVVFYPKGMGMGDVKYLAMVGVLLGWEKAIYTLFLGSLFGTLIMIPLLMLKVVEKGKPFSFGPFLVTATFVVMYLSSWLPWFY